MNKSMGKRMIGTVCLAALTISVLFTGCQHLSKQKYENTQTEQRTPVISELKTVKKTDDYYAAVNQNILKEHSQEENGNNWNWFYDMIEKVYGEQKQIIQTAAESVEKNQAEKNSSAYKLGMLYMLAKDQNRRDLDGIRYFEELMKPVMEAETIQECMNQIAILQYQYGFVSPVNMEVLALDEKPGEYIVQIKDLEYILMKEDFVEEDIEQEMNTCFTEYVTKLLTLSGRSEKNAKETAEKVFAFLKDMAKDNGKADYKMIPLEVLSHQLSNVNMEQYLTPIYQTMPMEISVNNLEAITKLNHYLTQEHLVLLKDYVFIVNLHKVVCYLSTDFVNAYQTFETNYVGDEEKTETERAIIMQVAELLKWDMGKLYTEKNFDVEEKKAVQNIVDELFEEYRSIISDADWLSEETRQKALQKLDRICVRIGIPEDIERYLSVYKPSAYEDGGSYLSNVLQIKGEESRKQYDNFGSPVDRTIWNLLPQDMNPCYYPTDNPINIPVAALETPYFSVTASEEENLGAIGTIIGHEITHAFDDLGSQYNENGDYISWWSDADRKAFEVRAEKIITFYDNYKTPGVMRQDGRQTLGENIADLGAMKCLSRIVEKKNLSAEKFFESYANTWASTSDAISDAMIAGMDEHAADKVRVNAVLSCCELFYKTYLIEEGDGMFIKPEERVELW